MKKINEDNYFEHNELNLIQSSLNILKKHQHKAQRDYDVVLLTALCAVRFVAQIATIIVAVATPHADDAAAALARKVIIRAR